jgi:hypothetical protein
VLPRLGELIGRIGRGWRRRGEGMWVGKRAGAGKKKTKPKIKAILGGIGIATGCTSAGWLVMRGPVKFSNAGSSSCSSRARSHPRVGGVVSDLQVFGRLFGGESRIGEKVFVLETTAQDYGYGEKLRRHVTACRHLQASEFQSNLLSGG